MSISEIDSTGQSGGTTNGGAHIEPCSCCRALAQVRLGWIPDSGMGIHSHGPAESVPAAAASSVKSNKVSFSIPGIFGANRRHETKRTESTKSAKQTDKADGSAASSRATDNQNDPATETAGNAEHADAWTDDLLVPKPKGVFHGLEGIAVMMFGVAIPSLMAVGCALSAPKRLTLVVLNHPVETIAELVLIAAVPFTIFFTWKSICRNNVTYSPFRGTALGAAIGTSLFIAGVCLAALFNGCHLLESEVGTSFTTGFSWITFLSLATAAIAAGIVNKFRIARDFSISRMQVVLFTAVGTVLSGLVFLAAEMHPWMVRLAESKAVSNSAEERKLGMRELRALNPERELRMECSDDRAAGLPGLFIPIKKTSLQSLYFSLTGKPYSFRDASSADLAAMPDEYLAHNVVGEKVKGLTLIRSSLDGIVHPHTLTSSMNWTFVFRNNSESPQEARAEISLPPRAVVAGLTLWRKGEPQPARFAAAGKAESVADNWTQIGHDGPAMVSDLGHGRVLLHCSPVEQEEELKVSVNIVVPVKPEDSKSGSLLLPRLLASNFALDGEHRLKMASSGGLSTSVKNLTASRSNLSSSQPWTLSGTLTNPQIEANAPIISVARPEIAKPIAVLDVVATRFAQEDLNARLKKLKDAADAAAREASQQPVFLMIDGTRGVQVDRLSQVLGSKSANNRAKKTIVKAVKPLYLVETVNRIAAPAPKKLVIVVDGSVTMKSNVEQLRDALRKLPQQIPTQVMIASDEGISQPMPVSVAIGKLMTGSFIGGQNNLQTVVKGAELAGDTKGGALLWIHGPQPTRTEEIYIMSPYTSAPDFYELAVGGGETDTYDLFRNHSEIGPFTQIPRNSAKFGPDLASFFAKWSPTSNDYAIELAETNQKPDDAIIASADEGRELLLLNTEQNCKRFIAERHIRKAARHAVAYGMVSSVSCALVTESTMNDINIDESDAAPGPSSVESVQPAAMQSETDGGGSIWYKEAPTLQGATNGTIGPQGGKFSYVSGLNTAGTVRVNNLANLEALLNIIANLSEIGCAVVGAVILLNGMINRTQLTLECMGREIEFSPGTRMLIGAILVIVGTTIPGLINWFVASARDANLFS